MKFDREKKATISKRIIFFALSTLTFILLIIVKKKDTQNTYSQFVKENSYFIPLKIQGFSSANIPYFEIGIEDKTIMAKIDLGYEGMISLPSNMIKELNKKKFVERIKSYGIRGKTYESDVYKVEKIEIEKMSFFPVKIEEENLEFACDSQLTVKKQSCHADLGAIGWHLFYSFNLLIDCQHSTLALCDSLETLKKQGYSVDSFAEASLILDQGSIDFEAMTEAGPLRCILDSGATLNILNKQSDHEHHTHLISENKKEDPPFLNPHHHDLFTFDIKNVRKFSSFKIGKKEFGPLTFNYIQSPVSIDAIMGMEFIDSTLIFIDFSNRKIYFYPYPQIENKLKLD